MWDLNVSVPDHCLSLKQSKVYNVYIWLSFKSLDYICKESDD